jgi:YYY domain-containing protein
MPISDFSLVFNWWFILLVLGLLFLPFTLLIFDDLFDKGYIFSKILATIFVSYAIFTAGTAKIVSFERINLLFIILMFFLLNLFIFIRKKQYQQIKAALNFFIFEEILFFLTLLFWSWIRSHQPDIFGLEKYMDFGFVNSILRSNYFPPKDMWYTPLLINYYYFGHLATAVLTKISSISPYVSYNLSLATLFALTFVSSFSITLNLVAKFRKTLTGRIAAGLLGAVLVSLSGNLHTVYSFFSAYPSNAPLPPWLLLFSPQTFPNNYWYPNATRFIPFTIHEFPSYSFVVSDLHGHVLDIPFVLLFIAFVFVIFRKMIFTGIKIDRIPSYLYLQALLAGFFLAVLYMTNAWDGLIYFLLLLGVYVVFWSFGFGLRSFWFFLKLVSISLFGFFIFSLPFSLHFKPFASGIGIVCGSLLFPNIERIGPFLFEPNHCQRSPLWQLVILYGFFYFWIIFFFLQIKDRLIKIKDKKIAFLTKTNPTELFILLLILISSILILIPEFAYIKDIYPAHYRANTMFKLVYQAFIMLSLVCAFIIATKFAEFKSDIQKGIFVPLRIAFFLVGIFLLGLVLLYPYFAINSYYNNLTVYRGLDGLSYLRLSHPFDYQAINWINKNIKGQPVLLEAQGDSYTDYERISSNTGIPTIVGWTVHEWLWRGDYGIVAPRISDVKTIYESENLVETERLLKKYGVEYVYVGELERQKYSYLNEDKFSKLGRLVYSNPQVRIYNIIGTINNKQ